MHRHEDHTAASGGSDSVPAPPRGTRRRTRTIALLAAALAATAVLSPTATADPGAATEPVPSSGCGTSTVGPGQSITPFSAAGRTGSFILDVPASNPGTPLPVVFDVHGYMQPAIMQRQWSGVGEFGLRNGFVTVTPEVYDGLPRWDYRDGGADIAYLSAVLTHVEQTLCVDRRRVYMTGLSMGAFTASSVACQLADRFAAVAPVAGLQNFPWCAPTRPVPAVAFHGTADTFLAYTGGLGPVGENLPATDGSARTAAQQRDAEPGADTVPKPVSIPDQAAAWAARNGCVGAPTTRPVTADVTRTVHPCAEDASVELYTIDGGGHTWPGGDTSTVPVALVGKVTNSIDADRIIWDFFRTHPLRGALR